MKTVLAAIATLLLVANVEAGCRRNNVAVAFVPTATFVAVPNNVVLLGSSTVVLNNNVNRGAFAQANASRGFAQAQAFGGGGISKAFTFRGPFGGQISRAVNRP